ncbi:hypothetical protein ABZ593_21120 [Streptomyces sp. NPDC012617]|uniref:hypothetical protein n=1 Tax=Streptomyces TaxID=1883 RepID=UPI0033DC2FE9
MSHFTDLNVGAAPALPMSPVRILAGVAAHFVDVRPVDVLAAEDLLVAVGAEAYILCGRSITGGHAELAAATLEMLPTPYVGITRGEYALLLIGEVNRSGEMWADDDNQRAIPTIPRPRTGTPAPRQPTPAERSADTAGVQA